MHNTQKLIVEAVTEWNPAIGNALQREFATMQRGGDMAFRADLTAMLTVALQSLDRNPAATRANLQNALNILRD